MSGWYADAWRTAVDGTPGMFPTGADIKPGRTLARKIGRLQPAALELQPGSITYRHDADRDPWACTLSIRPLPEADWARFMVQIADRPKLAAAVLTGQFPAGLEDPAMDAGVSLVPGRIDQLCSCDGWEEPCRHAVAVAFLVADLIEDDPFVIVLLLGRSRNELVQGVQEARSGSLGGPSGETDREPRGPDPTMDAETAFGRPLGPVPRSRPLPRRRGEPIPHATPPPSDAGIAADDLDALVADAAQRATDMLNGEGGACLHLAPDDDAARLASAHGRTGSGRDLDVLASAVGLDRDDLETRAAAWLTGGEAGLRVLESRWQPPPEALAEAERLFTARVRRAGNALVSGDVQLRLDEGGMWWRLESNRRTGWQLAAGPYEDPADALDPATG